MFKTLSRSIAQVLLPPLGYLLMRFYWLTSKKNFHIMGEISQDQSIVVCWHGELLMSPQAYRHFHKKQSASGIISRHFDGEMIARILIYFSIAPLRGSSSRGAKQVLLEAFRALKKGDDLLVTPDGPRGPRHSISDGAIALAHKAKAPVLTVNYIPKAYWQLGSWDKFLIPKPFTTIDFYLESVSLEGMELDDARNFLREKMLTHTVH
ncbi:lysophospholipid acyltransferase family protein [Sulfurovum sp. XGS-02]|uniref:lysophospholipid acyltransferase family protein n=1 Tax=Sulfurovum sp. XGS-02 TaxID=2925411 RepID=UPI002045C3D0|nr:lysophospholipid acyltransferase family protein [Sulfurovum sp. XGS-02]UPT77344.1 lysophospholipid acyltransferase family protein [Sulfurovum sp. XGS-02]